MRRLKWTVTASLIATLAVAGQAAAAVTVGQTISNTYDGNNCEGADVIPTATESGVSYAAPADGVLTSWSFQSSPEPTTLALRVYRPTGAANTYTVLAESAFQTVPVDAGNVTFPIRISVLTGDFIGIHGTAGECAAFGGPGDTFAVSNPAKPVGTTSAYTPNFGLIWDISAQLEPDADRDDFGDETQDQCPTDATTQGPCPIPPPTVDCQGTTTSSTNGTEGDDNLVGTVNPDGIFGLGGNDELDGVDGDDCLDAGEGDDRASGGADDDLVKGGDGRDKVRGLGGEDRLKGQGGVDRVNGGEGKDKLSGGRGDDKLNGGAAKDAFKGNSGDDDLNAVDAKSDRVNCGAGDDKAVIDPVDRVSRNCETVREVEKD